MTSFLEFKPPEGSPLGDCHKQVDDLRQKKKALKLALKNLVVMEIYKKVCRDEEEYLKLFTRILTEAKHTLDIT